MKFYWDTSALINAAVSKAVWNRLKTDDHFTRLHSFYEFFSRMTGRGITVADAAGNPARFVFSPNDAATWLRNFSNFVKLLELDPIETMDAFDKASAKGVMGALVYDYGHASVAQKANVDCVLTRNTTDFSSLTAIKVGWP